MLSRRNLTILNPEQYQEVFCFPIHDYYLKLGFDFSVESFESLAIEYVTEFDERSKKCELHIGAIEVLKSVKSIGSSQFILSAHEHNSLHDVLDSHNIKSYFEGIYGIEDCKGTSKVHRGYALIRDFNLKLDETVLVGDTDHDLEVANELGINCILVSSGHNSYRRLNALHEKVIPSLNMVAKT